MSTSKLSSSRASTDQIQKSIILRAPRSLSGVHCRQEGDFAHHVEALAQTILRLTEEEGRVANWCVVEIFPLLRQHHWDAYARLAGVCAPSPQVIAATVERYRELIQYPDDAQPMGELFTAF